MNLPWIFFAIFAPTLWAITNVFDGALRKYHVKDDFTLTWLSGISKIPFVIVFFWLGGIEFPNMSSVFGMLIAGAFWTFPLFFYFKAIEKEEPSRVALLLQLVPIFALINAYIFLGESLSQRHLVIFVILIAGGSLAAIKKIDKQWHFSRTFVLILLASLIWSLSDVGFKKFEPSYSDFISAFAFYFFSSFVITLPFIAHRPSRSKINKHLNISSKGWWMVAISFTSGNLGAMSFAYALTLKEVSLTAVLMGIQPLLVMIFGFALAPFIKEIKHDRLSKEELTIKGVSFFLIMLGLVLLQVTK